MKIKRNIKGRILIKIYSNHQPCGREHSPASVLYVMDRKRKSPLLPHILFGTQTKSQFVDCVFVPQW